MKEAIKKIITVGATVSIAYKSKINQWYGEIKIYGGIDEDTKRPAYTVTHKGMQNFNDIDEAVNYFCYHGYTSKNLGLVQNRLMEKGLLDNVDDRDFEKPSSAMLLLFKQEGDIVDLEAATNNITKPSPSITLATAELAAEEIFKIATMENVLKLTGDFKHNFQRLDARVSFIAFYRTKSGETYSHSCNMGQISKEGLIKMCQLEGDVTFENLNLKINLEPDIRLTHTLLTAKELQNQE